MDCVEGHRLMMQEQLKFRDILNHTLASYIAVGVNNPKKFPKHPQLVPAQKEHARTFTTDGALEEFIKDFNERNHVGAT